jgi:hypothetical protein
MAEGEQRPRIRMLGPRGVEGFFGWTFFDPANLVVLPLLGVSATLVVLAFRARGAPDTPMVIGLYLCLAAFLRGYFFKYYHGRAFGRVVVLLILIVGLLVSAAFWYDDARVHEELRASGPVMQHDAPNLRLAALLHVVAAVTILLHYVLPRRWLVRFTDDLAERAGREERSEGSGPTSAGPG